MDGTVAVDGGRVRGTLEAGVWRFLGVPYARAPVGPLRWRPPEPPAPWVGVRDASRPGPLAPQADPAPGSVMPGDPLDQDEDCLYVNVWTPAPDDGRRPVLVWVHGGGFTSGTASSALYRGDGLARRGDAVVVAVNYRLGALGFLAHPALADDDRSPSGNWALLDQVAALRWVQDNIGAFGGDPSNVTVFGESAGAMCISALLAMPAARGLCTRAIVQSGPPYVHDAARAAASAEAFADLLGLDGVTRRALEAVPAAALVRALSLLARRRPRAGELPQPMLPVVDGRSLRQMPLDALREGSASGVATIVGTNRDEMTFFELSDSAGRALDETRLAARLAHAAPLVSATDVVDLYRKVRLARGEPVSARDIWIAAGSDAVFRWPSLRLATALAHHEPRTFTYLFAWTSPALGGALGAAHALEIPFVFGATGLAPLAPFVGDGPDARVLSEAIQEAWLAFARTGDPSNDRTGVWSPWEPTRRPTMVFDRVWGMEDAPRDEELAVWESVLPLHSHPAPSGDAVH